MNRQIKLVIRLAVLLAVAGVAAVLIYSRLNKPLDLERTFNLGPGDTHAVEFDSGREPGTVTVRLSSTGANVNVYLVKKQDQEAATQAILDYKVPQNVLAKVEKAKEGTLEAMVPSGTGLAVLVAGATRDTEVKVHVKSK